MSDRLSGDMNRARRGVIEGECALPRYSPGLMSHKEAYLSKLKVALTIRERKCGRFVRNVINVQCLDLLTDCGYRGRRYHALRALRG